MGRRLSNALLAAVVSAGGTITVAHGADIEVPDAVEPCVSCHAFRPDEPALEGPTLWGVVGRRIASVEGFDYSTALRKLEGTWTPERLDGFLTSPRAYAPGTRMTLGGVKNAAERRQVIEFLESLRPQDDQ